MNHPARSLRKDRARKCRPQKSQLERPCGKIAENRCERIGPDGCVNSISAVCLDIAIHAVCWLPTTQVGCVSRPYPASRSLGLARTSESCVRVMISLLRRLIAAHGSCITTGSRRCCGITMTSTLLCWLTATEGGCNTDSSRLSCDSYMDFRRIRYGRRIARL